MPWQFFSEDELKCKHCGQIHMDESFMQKLIAARKYAGIPFPINSGYRCPEYDQSIGGEGNHTEGKAVDIMCTTSFARFKIVEAAIMLKFNRIGIAKTFIHLDTCLSGKPQCVIWFY